MQKILKVVGAIVVLWIAFSIVGAIVGFVAHAVLWVALIAGGGLRSQRGGRPQPWSHRHSPLSRT